LNVTLGPAGSYIIGNNRLTEARRFGETDAPGDYGVEDCIFKEISKVLLHLAGKVGAVIVHCEENAFDLQVATERFSNTIDGIKELGYSF
jgi:hypothetical protein